MLGRLTWSAIPFDEPLPQADIDLIKKWIAAGAMNN